MTKGEQTVAILDATEAAGFEQAYAEESCGSRSYELLIFVKMSNRKIDHEKDSRHIFEAARALKRGFDTVTAQLDPEVAATREAYLREIREIYAEAGVPSIYLEALPNGYCSEPCCLNKPWARVTSAIGPVIIGGRKRVIAIEWKDTIVKASGEALFPAEDVTRWETGIHAYGRAKAAEYIKRLHGESDE